MRPQEPDSPAGPTQHPSILGDFTDPKLHARNLFARHSGEFPLWDSVAKQLSSIEVAQSPPSTDASYARLRVRMDATSTSDPTSRPTPTTRTPAISRWFVSRNVASRWVAIVVAVLMVNVSAFYLVNRWFLAGNTDTSVITYTTRNAERTEVTLSDGTHVSLNVGSRLQVPRTFGQVDRTLFLEGEAQFVVRHDPARPFVVHAGMTVVRDLATRFVVRAYRDVARTAVAVAEGKVAVQASTLSQPSSAILEAGEVATISLEGFQVTAQRSPDEFFGWIGDTLVFNHTPVSEALAQIARWYDVDCQVNDTSLLMTSDLTFTLSGRTLTDRQLKDLGDVLGARVERYGRKITFISNSPANLHRAD